MQTSKQLTYQPNDQPADQLTNHPVKWSVCLVSGLPGFLMWCVIILQSPYILTVHHKCHNCVHKISKLSVCFVCSSWPFFLIFLMLFSQTKELFLLPEVPYPDFSAYLWNVHIFLWKCVFVQGISFLWLLSFYCNNSQHVWQFVHLSVPRHISQAVCSCRLLEEKEFGEYEEVATLLLIRFLCF